MGSSFSSATKPKIFYPPSPEEILVKKPGGGVGPESLSKLVEEHCPSLRKEFNPPWWLKSGHLQTLFSVAGDFTNVDKVVYERTYLRLMDGGTLGLDFTPPGSTFPDDAPIIVVCHGLTGGSYEAYVRAVLAPACAPVSEGGLGYRAVVVNFRGCAGVPVTSKQLYSAGWTEDLRMATIYLAHKYPRAPQLGLGFSLGANVMVRYLAEEGERSRLESACVLGNVSHRIIALVLVADGRVFRIQPWDLVKNNWALEHTFLGKQIYSKGMANNLVNVLKLHSKALEKVDPPTPSPTSKHEPDSTQASLVCAAYHAALALRSPPLSVFDNTFTRVGGGGPPVWPLASADAYYKHSSSHHVVPQVRKPLLAINSTDDPVVVHAPTSPEEVGSGYTVVVLTDGGGHLGWFEPSSGQVLVGTDVSKLHLRRWMTKPALEWLRLAAEVLVHGHPDHPPKDIFVDENGWIREVNGAREGLGCRMVDGGDLIDGTELKKEPGMLQGL
ncbi:Alpha/Beta hydrolase protein [Lentinula boryana]|uniref:Alpha/Beta hydrolase protein n=1 Tax=Lentinula boryana TaxID=40481 RepID=A0ABQ8QIN6_9AGAR|nr:Alpha/Beta hydrolase protein [Lentinula boryana]